MSSLTRARLVFVRDRINVWLRFGRFFKEVVIDAQIRDVYFTPHAVFSCITWRTNDHRTTEWRVDVLRALALGEPASQVPHVEPGAEILLRTSGASNVRVLLSLFDKIEAHGISLSSVSTDYWGRVHNRLAANQSIAALTRETQTAFDMRRKLAP